MAELKFNRAQQRVALMTSRRELKTAYHRISDVIGDRSPSNHRAGDPEPEPVLRDAFRTISHAINLLNKELGLPKDS